MAFRADEQWLQDYIARGGKVQQMGKAPPGAAVPGGIQAGPTEKRPKYGNQKTELDGKKFDSKHEAKMYEELRLRCQAGEYIGLGLQVTFYLPGGIKYKADFVAVRPDGSMEVMDAKSEATKKDKVYRLKKRLMKECYKIEIKEI